MAVELTYRPLITKWPKPETPWRERIAGGWKYTGLNPWVEHLSRELDHLKVREALIEVDADPVHFKKFGGLFADAKVKSPRVLATFDLPDTGTLRYACDHYKYYEFNIHAIGLTLERLRLVDSYGATTGHEQYRGFKALPGAGETSVERELTAEEAAAHLVATDPQWAKFDAAVRLSVEGNVLRDTSVAKTVILAAVRTTHPDTGGSPETFAAVQRARVAIAKHHGADL